jgi:hypothetical protein
MDELGENARFPVRCTDDLIKYRGKKALFQAQCGTRYFELVGELAVHHIGDQCSIDLHYWGPPLAPFNPVKPEGICIHLSQEWVDSISPASVSPSGDKADFQIQNPFQFRHCFSSTSDRSPEP